MKNQWRRVYSALMLSVILAAPAMVFADEPTHEDHGSDHGHAHEDHGSDHGHGDADPVEHGHAEHGEGAHAEGEHGEGAHAEGEHSEGGAHHGPAWNEIGASAINFALYLGLIVFFGRKPLTNYFNARRDGIADELEKSKVLVAAAETKLAELESKMSTFEQERDEILSEFRQLGEIEKARILEAARHQADKIESDAELRVEQEARSARAALEGRLVDAALVQAREEVAQRLTPDLHRRMLDSYITELGQPGQ